MGKFTFFNDTNKVVKIHPATSNYATFEDRPINHLETRDFYLKGDDIEAKMWDYKSHLVIFVSSYKGGVTE